MIVNQSLTKIIKDSYKIVSTDSIYDWARKNISLPPGVYAEPGPFNVHKSRYLIEPFHAIKDNGTRVVICNAAVQTGKSLLADISIPYFVLHKPGPIQFSQATDEMVKNHINNRLYPLLQSCKPLRSILPPNDKDFTNFGIKFPNMVLYTNGEKVSAFQAKSIKFAICDEAHMWDRGRLSQAIDRVSAFERKGTSKVLIVSQPDQVDSDFLRMYELGTMEEWQVPCQGCGKYFFPIWRKQKKDGSFYGMLWDSNEITKPAGKWNINEVLKTVRYECEFCGYKHIDSKELKKIWNLEGKYVSQNPSADNKVRSFRWNAVVKNNWYDLVIKFIEAKELANINIMENLTQFFQKYITEAYDPNFYEGIGRIKTDVYDVQSDWPEACVRFASIDVQKYHFWVLIREWARDSSSRMLFFGKVSNESELKDLLTKFKVNQQCVFVDVANAENGDVWAFVDRNQWTGLRGDHWADEKGYQWNIRNTKVTLYYSQPALIPNSRNQRWYYNFAPNPVSDIAAALRDGKGQEFKCLDSPEYKKQMFAEKKLPIKNKYGQISWKWQNKSQADNHAWDCEKMQVVGALIHPEITLIPPSVVVTSPEMNN